jgi:hypothetical protein
MEHKILAARLQPLLVDATAAADQVERLRSSLEGHASVLPADFMREFEVLVEQLRILRDDIHDAGLDPTDHTALSHRQRPDDDRPPARLQDLPIKPGQE